MKLMFKCGTCNTLYSVNSDIFFKAKLHHCPNCDARIPVDVCSFIDRLVNLKDEEFSENWEVYGLPEE